MPFLRSVASYSVAARWELDGPRRAACDSVWFVGRRQRAKADLFSPVGVPHWLVVETGYGRLMESTAIPPGADLMRLFISTLAKYHDDGWKLIEFSSYQAHFYATKGDDKRFVQITSTDPATPKQPAPNMMQGVAKR